VTHRLIFEPEAEGELEAASLWYDQQRPGLGRRFLSAIDLTLDRIRRFPSAGAPVPRTSEDLPVRRAPVARFPYHVVYLETSKTLYVLAVAHDRRKPGYWKGRLKS
jgi:plasmid stabilization system protein ParE